MDIWTLAAATVATVLTGYAVYYWALQIWFFWLRPVKFGEPIFETQAKHVQEWKNLWIASTGFLGFLLAFIWIWVTSFHWITVVAFAWPYATGYAWCIVVAKAALKRPRMASILIAAIVTLLAVGALLAIIDITGPLPTFFNVAVLTLNLGTNHLPINGYTLLGVGGLVLVLGLLPVFIGVTASDLKTSIDESRHEVEEKASKKAREDEEKARKDRESISDEALRLEILQKLDLGQKVTAENFPDVNVGRIHNAMAALTSELASAALIYDSFMTTITYRNAEGVRRIHDACISVRVRPGTAATLVQAFVKELGLPEALPDAELGDAYFFTAKVQAGSLSSVLPSTFPVFVPLLSDQQIREEKVRELFRNRLNEARPLNRFAIVLSPNSSSLLRDLLIQPDEEVHDNIVYLNEEDMRSVIISKAPDIKTTFMRLVRRNVRLTTVSPFITEGPTEGEMFVGREREINNMLQSIDSHSYAILGGRRIGKTSIVKRVQLNLQKQECKVFDLGCDAVTNYEDFYRTLRSEWIDELGTYHIAKEDYIPVTFREIAAILSASKPTNSPLVFIFDEIDKLLNYDMRQQNREQLFRTFRDLSQRKRCQFIFSGERRIYQQLNDATSPFFNFCSPVKLGLLTLDDARKLIEEPFERLNIPLDGGRDLTDCIVDICSRHPNLIQKMCLELLTELDKSGDILYPRITQELVTHVARQPDFRGRYLKVFWEQSTPLERAIVLLMRGDESIEPQGVAARLQQNGFQVSQKQLDTALDYLTLYCIFQHDADGISWTANHFDEIASEDIFDRQQYIAELRNAFSHDQEGER